MAKAKQPKPRKKAVATKKSRSGARPASRKKAGPRATKKGAPPVDTVAVAVRQAAYAEAVGRYEHALVALQRRDFAAAASQFQAVIDEYPEERELHERCRLYLRVCERETQQPQTPQTLEERILAATLALNAGAPDEALRHLEATLVEAPDSDQVQYMLAMAQAASGQSATAIDHLRRAIELNPDNRFLARQEASFDTLQDDDAFRELVDTPSA